MNCTNCAAELTPVIDGADPDTLQLDNVLELEIHGGYGMFTDWCYPDPPVPHIFLCHICAHLLCADFPAFQKVIDPQRSHSHREGSYLPGHRGWDLDRRRPVIDVDYMQVGHATTFTIPVPAYRRDELAPGTHVVLRGDSVPDQAAVVERWFPNNQIKLTLL